MVITKRYEDKKNASGDSLTTHIIRQSPNDKRHYHFITLPNGLKTLLIHQADAEKSAVALTINAGHFDDPTDKQGLAHFLEHMLFLGSANYPQAGELQNFISQHSGSNNAWTGTEHSQFFFDINTNFLEPALARFADMFRQPLFDVHYIEKERQSIDAEFSLKLKDDGRRIYQVHKETVNPAHPFAKFSVGNLQTLADTDSQPLQQSLQAFYQQQYAASRMTLVLLSPLPLSDMQQLLQQYFADLPNHLPAKAPLQHTLYLPEQLALKLNIQPVKDSKKLVVSFALPDVQCWYQYKLISFIAHLLGNESSGSLFSYLKKQGLTDQLSVGGGIDGSNYKDFSLAFDLTPKGRQQYPLILQALFRQLAELKQSPFPLALFKEQQKLLTWSYLYQEPATPLQTACQLSVNMQHYPDEDVIYGDYRMDDPPETLYQHILAYFTPDNMRLMLIAKDVYTNKQAKWYQTPYSIEPVAAELLQQLRQPVKTPELLLPTVNPYMVDDISLLDSTYHMQTPRLYYQDAYLSLWFKADTEFFTPKGHIFLHLNLPNSTTSVRQLAATRLWIELFQDQVRSFFYTAKIAGLNYHLHVQKKGITLHTSGLSNNQIALACDLLQQMRRTEFTAERFSELKQKLLKHWSDLNQNKPISRLLSRLSAFLQPENPETEQLAIALNNIDFNDFTRFNTELLEQVNLEGLLLGNWQQSDAFLLQQNLSCWLNMLPSKSNLSEKPAVHLPQPDTAWLNVDLDHHEHALVIYLPALDASARQTALFMLANHVLSPAYFQQLRTEQQLGYLVGTGYAPVNNLPGMIFYIQSPNHDSHLLYQATTAFFDDFIANIAGCSDTKFSSLKSALQLQLQKKDASLSARAKRFWLALMQQDHNFSLNTEIINALNNLTLDEFLSFLQHIHIREYQSVSLASSKQDQDNNNGEKYPDTLNTGLEAV